VCKTFGHLTKNCKKVGNMINNKSLQIFLGTLASYETGFIQEKIMKENNFMEDLLLQKHTKYEQGKPIVDINSYKKDYYTQKLTGEEGSRDVCLHYISGLNWVINYYKIGIPSWNWYYPFFYGPFLSDMHKYVMEWKYTPPKNDESLNNIEQLMCVMPKVSHNLLPSPFDKIISVLHPEFYPEEFKIDYSGKRREWEGIVLLPMVDISKVRQTFKDNQSSMKDDFLVKENDTFVYKNTERVYEYKSYYGDITDCSVNKKFIKL
jgi:5'-3' exonuclease